MPNKTFADKVEKWKLIKDQVTVLVEGTDRRGEKMKSFVIGKS